MQVNQASLEDALLVLGEVLAARGLHYEVAAIGGGSLLLLGLIDRTTKDLDLLAMVKNHKLFSASPLPNPLVQAAEEVGRALNLGKNWLNSGPASLLETGLPAGFIERMHIRKYKGLTLYLADRLDQICFKLYASVDQGPYSKHFADLCALNPTSHELSNARDWCASQDVSPQFAKDLSEVVKAVDVIA